jgi:hypothetical protein
VSEQNSQFTIRREISGGNLPLPDTITTATGAGNSDSPPDTTVTTTDTDTTVTGNTTVDTDTTTTTTNTTSTTTDKPSTTTDTSKDGLPKAECGSYCKMYNVLNLGMSAALIIFLLALSYRALKTVAKAKD